MTIVRFDLSAAPRIGIDEAKQKFDQAADIVFVDVRSRVDFDKAHIPGAIAMPLREFSQRLRELPRDKEIIPY